jgi:hypothetical protein
MVKKKHSIPTALILSAGRLMQFIQAKYRVLLFVEIWTLGRDDMLVVFGWEKF